MDFPLINPIGRHTFRWQVQKAATSPFLSFDGFLEIGRSFAAAWGGHIKIGGGGETTGAHTFSTIRNRCVVFETNEIRYHEIPAARGPEGRSRKSFAASYETKDAHTRWPGKAHANVFNARPLEVRRGNVQVPPEPAKPGVLGAIGRIHQKVKGR